MQHLNDRLIKTEKFQKNPLSSFLLEHYDQWKNHEIRLVTSSHYNYFFDYFTCDFWRCGSNIKDDPKYSQIGPECLEIEVSNQYEFESKTEGKSMSFDFYRKIFRKFPKNLCEIYFHLQELPPFTELESFLKHCDRNPQNKRVVPSLYFDATPLTLYHFDLIKDFCGKVFLKFTDTYNTIQLLQTFSELEFSRVYLLFKVTYTELPEIKHFLTKLEEQKFPCLVNIDFQFVDPIPYPQQDKLLSYYLNTTITSNDLDTRCVQRSALLYYGFINLKGFFYPIDSQKNWEPYNLNEVSEFLDDVWYHPQTRIFRERILEKKETLFNGKD